MSASVSSSGLVQAADPGAGRRIWFAVAGAVVIVVCLLPPVATLSLRYVVAESIQFAMFSMVAPALIVLGAPWRVLRLSRPGGTGLADRLAAARRGQQSFLRAGLFLLAFMAVTLAWRLPPVMNTLVHQPALILAELVTLVPAGIFVWLELLKSPPLAPRLPRPHRATIAALAMWFTWGVAYVIGFQSGPVFGAYAAVASRALSVVADQELSVMIMWTVAGLCFIPLVIINMLGWLKDDDTDEELQRLVRDAGQRAVVRGWGPPVKAWQQQPRGGSDRAT